MLFILFSLVFIFNFPFDSWFTGWDNLHPEFNFLLNFKRAFQSVWQQNQGLGTFGGHAYAATLPHTIITFFMSLIIPQQYIRALFTFMMLITGAIGIFFLVKKLLEHFSEDIQLASAFLAGSYYMFNLSTVQNFYVQLEAFIIHFAGLPWLFVTLIYYLNKPNKKNLFLFFIVSVITTAQGFIPPLFFVYLIMLCTFLTVYVITNFNLRAILSSTLIVVITLLINSYWLLPVLYYTNTNSSTYLNAYSNLSSTEDFILKNKKYGDIKNVTLLKGFIFESIDTIEGGKIISIFQQWQNHIDKPIIKILGYSIFGFIAIGVLSVFDKKNKYILCFFVGLILLFSFLATNTFPFSLVTDVMQKIPPLRQAFRVAFTKFSIGLSFYYAIFFGMGMSVIFRLFAHFLDQKEKKVFIKVAMTIVLLVLIYFSYPIFTGNFLYKRTKLVLPSNYLDTFEFFNKQDKESRIADFPQGWYWGWTVDKWGYSGSGFWWYGIEQPIMHRSFDVWGKYNENYYWEINNAIYSEQFNKIDAIFEKYRIEWVLFDKNLIPYPNTKSFLYADRLEEYFNQNPKYTISQVFKAKNNTLARDIKIYKVRLSPEQTIIKTENIKNIGPIYGFTDNDIAYREYGTYISDETIPYDVFYPFRSLLTKRKLNELPISVKNTPNTIMFDSNIPKGLEQYTVVIPPFNEELYATPSVTLINQTLSVNIQKSPSFTLVYDSSKDYDFFSRTTQNVVFDTGSYQQKIVNNDYLQLSSKNSENFYQIILDKLEQRNAYIVFVENRHEKGKQMRLAVINSDSRKTDSEVSLTDNNQFTTDYIIIPPMKQYGLGYTLSFNNISIGEGETINDIRNIQIYKIPYDLLTQLKFINPTPHTYSGFITNYQSYNEDWKASINSIEQKKHILVNNWANGWIVDSNDLNSEAMHVSYFFAPQLIQNIGFGLLIFSMLLVFIIPHPHEKNI